MTGAQPAAERFEDERGIPGSGARGVPRAALALASADERRRRSA